MPIPRIEIADHKAFGKMVVKWSQEPESRPGSLDELKAQCVDILLIPDRIKKLAWVDVDLETFLVRVPNKEMVTESVERFSHDDATTSGGYPAPAFYSLIDLPNPPPDLEILFSRIADYTIAQCV